MLIVFQLIAAHAVADFVLQSDRMARHKRKPGPLLAHASVHFLCSCVSVNLGLNVTVVAAIALLSTLHALIDYVKARLEAHGWVAFVVDQAIHALTIGAVALCLSSMSWSSISLAGQAVLTSRTVYVILAAYVAIVLGGGFLVQKVTGSFLVSIDSSLKQLKPGIPKAGTYIGWVERFLVLTFVLAGFNEAVGFLLAVKAFARYPEIKDDKQGHFAEYFLVGTLTSFGVALVGALLARETLARF